MPTLPKTVEEIAELLTPNLLLLSGHQFVYMDASIMMLLHPKMIEHLQSKQPVNSVSSAYVINFSLDVDTVSMDATFKTCPRLFKQLYTLHAMEGDTIICCAYFLLPEKWQSICVKVCLPGSTVDGARLNHYFLDVPNATGRVFNLCYKVPNRFRVGSCQCC